MLLQENPSAEHLLDLVGRLDCLLRLHQRKPALIQAEALFETLRHHHRALHRLQQASDDAFVQHLEDLAGTLIAEVAFLIGELRLGDRWPEAGLRRQVADFVAAEATKAAHIVAVTMTGSTPWSPGRSTSATGATTSDSSRQSCQRTTIGTVHPGVEGAEVGEATRPAQDDDVGSIGGGDVFGLA